MNLPEVWVSCLILAQWRILNFGQRTTEAAADSRDGQGLLGYMLLHQGDDC